MSQNAVPSELLVRCACGFEALGTAAALMLVVEEHAIEAHNVHVTDERVLAIMLPALPSRCEAGSC